MIASFARLYRLIISNHEAVICLLTLSCGLFLYSISSRYLSMHDLLEIKYVTKSTQNNDIITVECSLYNKMDFVIHIVDVHRSCTCLTAVASSQEIPSRQSVVVKFDIDVKKVTKSSANSIGAVVILRAVDGAQLALFISAPDSVKKTLLKERAS